MRTCAFNTSPEIFFLDHISPLASLLNIPLIITEAHNAKLTEKYYPEVKIRHMPDLEFRLKEVSDEFDALIECSYWAPQLKKLFSSMFSKDMKLIFCPHGQSDKGFRAPSLMPYAQQEAVLIYGNLMKQMLMDLQLWESISAHAPIGNFRYNYYKKHRARLLDLAETEIFSLLQSSNRTLLYAPTWMDDEGSSTFFEYAERLFREIPSDWNLIIKVHPLLSERHPSRYYRLSLLEEKRSNFILVDEFPLIYPILDKVDAYLGDYSSIGYDALAFQKPMFFLTRDHLPKVKLHTCGQVIDPSQNLFQAIDRGCQNASRYHLNQKALYLEAFANVENIKEAISCLEC